MDWKLELEEAKFEFRRHKFEETEFDETEFEGTELEEGEEDGDNGLTTEQRSRTETHGG